MAQQIALTVQKRSVKGKCHNRRLRQQGFVPGVYYNAEGDNVSLQIQELPLKRIWQQLGNNHLFQLTIEGDSGNMTVQAMIWNVQLHPLKKSFNHVDFYGVDPNKKLKLNIPVVITGEAPGVKCDGGVLGVYRDKLEIICLPTKVPDKIILDVSAMQLGQCIYIKDIVLPKDVQALYDDNFAVVAVQHRHKGETPEEKVI